MDCLCTELLLLLAVFVAFLFWRTARPRKFPPGPLALPLLGNLLHFNLKAPLKHLDKFSEKYGPVYSLYMGGVPVVFVHGFHGVKDVLVNKGLEFADRPQSALTEAITKGKGIVGAHYGQSWKEHRRFTLSTLRNFGLGKKSMEERIREETSYLLQSFEAQKDMDAPFDPHFAIVNAVSNIICSITLGRRYEYDDSSFRNIINLVHENMKSATGFWAQMYNATPLVRPLPLPHRKIFKNMEAVTAFLMSVQEEHKKTLVPGEPRDYIDSYLEEMEKQQKQHGGDAMFDEESLFASVTDLFIAGTESTSTTLLWGLLYMMAYPDIQEKCHEEIYHVFGDDGQLNYDDKANTPYTLAVIHEIQRLGNVVPLGVSHTPVKEVHLAGYVIPKGTIVATNLSSVHLEESQWKFPHDFNPSNFLNDKGEFVKPEAFLPFGAGPRGCLGENLARMELFLFFTALLRHFRVSWPGDSSVPDFTGHFGITQTPTRFKMRVTSRLQN